MLSVVCWYRLIGLWETKGTGPPLGCQCTDGNNGDKNTATCFVYHQATDLPSPLKFLFLTIITTRFPSQTLASWHLVDGAPSRPVLGNRQYVGASHEWIMHLIGCTGFIDWRSRRKVLCLVTTSHREKLISGIKLDAEYLQILTSENLSSRWSKNSWNQKPYIFNWREDLYAMACQHTHGDTVFFSRENDNCFSFRKLNSTCSTYFQEKECDLTLENSNKRLMKGYRPSTNVELQRPENAKVTTHNKIISEIRSETNFHKRSS